ncbi:MAG: hypothetical protein ACLFR2_05160 [Candidatus Kapaibacterium sp.]
MNTIKKETIKQFLEYENGPCVSLYMPTHRAGQEIRQNSIRLKNLISDAEEKLVKQGLRAPDAKKILKPASDLIDDEFFIMHQNVGLAMFLSKDKFEEYRLPVDFTENVFVNDRFHIKPLIPLLSEGERFYILALSKNEVRLFHCTMNTITEVELKDVPTSMQEALGYEEYQKHLQLHTETAQLGRFNRQAVYHGQGTPEEDIKKDIKRYFHRVADGLTNYLHNEDVPLIIAAVDYLHPIYKESANYTNILKNGINGNPEEMKPKELYDRAIGEVKDYYDRNRQEAINEYEHFSGAGNASNELQTILKGAESGRVKQLFVELEQYIWGKYDSSKNVFITHEEKEKGDEDLLDLAAAFTIMNNGRVFALVRDKMPDDSPVAAVFRY